MKNRLASLVVAVGSAAMAAYGGDYVVSGETVVDVASGVTSNIDVKVTGDGWIHKTGAGKLVLSNSENDFTGGITIDAGTVRATAGGAFGTGPITNVAASAAAGRVEFAAPGGEFPNDYVQKLGATANTAATGPVFFECDTTLRGDFSAVGNNWLRMFPNGSVANPSTGTGPTVHFYGDVYSNTGIYSLLYGNMHFHGKVVQNIETVNSGTWASGGVWHFHNSSNAAKAIQVYSGVANLCAENVISNSIMQFTAAQTGVNPYGYVLGSFYLNGFSQRVRSLYSNSTAPAETTANTHIVTTGAEEPVTLTILGEATSRSTSARLSGPVTLVLDSASYPSFVQTFTIRESVSTGDIVVSNGTMSITTTASFRNVRRIHVATNGTLVVASTATRALSGVTRLEVYGTLKLDAAGTMPFADGEVELYLGSGATLEIGDSLVLSPKSLFVDGVPAADGDYREGGKISQIKGDGMVSYSSSEVTDGEWIGGAADNAMSTAGNWQDGIMPNLSGGKSVVTVSSGSTMAVDANASIGRFVFAQSGDFSVVSSDGVLSVATNAFAFSAPAQGRTVTVSAPLAVNEGGTWTVPQGDVLSLSCVTSPVPLKVGIDGGGEVRFDGASQFDGGFEAVEAEGVSNATLRVRGTLGTSTGPVLTVPAEGGMDAITLKQYASRLVLDGATVEKPVVLRGVQSSVAAATNALVCLAGTSNVLAGTFRSINAPVPYIYLEDGASLTFEGGMQFDWSCIQWGGTAYVRGRPYVARSSTFGFGPRHGRLVVETFGNTVRGVQICGDGILDARVSYAYTNGIMNIANNDYPYVAVLSPTLELNSTTQRVEQLLGTTTAGTIRGGAGARLEILSSGTNSCDIAGAATVAMLGGGTLLMQAREYATSGGLEALSGTVDLAAGAAFMNATRVFVGPGGRVKAASSGAFTKKAALYLSEGAALEVPAGVRLRFGEVWTEAGGAWTKAEPGVYRSDDLPAINGAGEVIALGGGMVLTFR